jgi:phosphatidylserine decarboxylase
MTITVIGILLSATAVLASLWWLSIPILIFTVCLVLFFRDPDRPIPTQRGIMVAPADGKVSSIHEVEFFEPFNGPATCVRIFLSVFDVHINRSPIHGVVTSVTHKPGQHLNVLNPESAEVNEYNLIIMAHPVRRDVIAAVRQVAGLCARTICCTVGTGSVVQRGQRIGIIKLGSTTELYIPARFSPQVVVEQGQYVYGGSTILANINLGPAREGEEDEDGTTPVALQPTEPSQADPQSEPQNADETDGVDGVEAAIAVTATAVAAEQVVSDVQVAEVPETLTADTVNLDDDVIVEDEADATDEMDAIEDEDTEETSEESPNEASNEQEDYVEEPDAEELETSFSEPDDEASEDDELNDEDEEKTSDEDAHEELDDDQDEDEESEDEDESEDESEDDQDTSDDDDDVTDDDEIESDETSEDEDVEEDSEEELPKEKDPKGKPGKKKSEDDDSPMLF